MQFFVIHHSDKRGVGNVTIVVALHYWREDAEFLGLAYCLLTHSHRAMQHNMPLRVLSDSVGPR